MSPRVLISIVTWNSAPHLKECLESLTAQTCRDYALCLWDNASADNSAALAQEFSGSEASIHCSGRNIGFCAAHNRVIASHPGDYVLVLNPDVVLEPSFLAVLVQAMDQRPAAGSATGKLWRWEKDTPPASAGRILDTTGIYFTPNQRHLDRGSGEPDQGQYETPQYVFGASGAAAFYRRSMLEDVRMGAEYFDEMFFAYREDADLAWRAQWLGWSCLYVPEARGFHVRRVLPERRSQLPSAINMHSFKNRFLLRLNNMDSATYARFLLPITLRDAAAFGYVLLREPASLRALPLICKAIPHAWRRRKHLQKRRRITPYEMRSWFANHPVAKPIPN